MCYQIRVDFFEFVGFPCESYIFVTMNGFTASRIGRESHENGTEKIRQT